MLALAATILLVEEELLAWLAVLASSLDHNVDLLVVIRGLMETLLHLLFLLVGVLGHALVLRRRLLVVPVDG